MQMGIDISPEQEPTFVAPLATPTLGPGGSWSVVCSTSIAAPPTTCLEIMLDPATYPSWNRWIQKAVVQNGPSSSAPSVPAALSHIASRPGQLVPQTKFYFEAHMNPDSPSFHKTELEVTVLEEFERDGRRGYRVAWKSQEDPWSLRAERVQEFLETADGGCEYRSNETFHGPLSWVVRLAVGAQLRGGLTLWRDGLKREAERMGKISR